MEIDIEELKELFANLVEIFKAARDKIREFAIGLADVYTHYNTMVANKSSIVSSFGHAKLPLLKMQWIKPIPRMVRSYI